MAAGAINGIVYVVAGIGIDWTTNRARLLARVDAYNIATNTWFRVASMPGARSYPTVPRQINGKLYVSGGLNHDDRPTKTLFVYDPMTNSWAGKADMPQPGCAGVQGVINAKLYVYMFGCDRFAAEVVVRFYRYNPATDTWVTRALPPGQILSSSGGAIGGKFYIADTLLEPVDGDPVSACSGNSGNCGGGGGGGGPHNNNPNNPPATTP